MKTSRFEVLSQAEVERIHAASMEILATVGIRVDYGRAREIFRQAGADGGRRAAVRPHPGEAGALGGRSGAGAVHAARLRPGVPPGDRRRPRQLRRARHPDAHPRHGDGRAPADHLRRCRAPHPTGGRLPAHQQHADGRLAERHPHDHHPHRVHLGVGQPRPQAVRDGLLRLSAHAGHDAHDGAGRGRQGGAAPPAALLRHLLGDEPAANGADAGRGAADLRGVRPAAGDVAGSDRRRDRARRPWPGCWSRRTPASWRTSPWRRSSGRARRCSTARSRRSPTCGWARWRWARSRPA